MNVQPVIVRELLAQSRQPGTYWLRVVAAAVVMGVFAFAASGPARSGQELGEYLFDTLNAATYHVILLCVPLLTADAISREKREGTLGLLFLTPLRAGDIVVGKAISQALRGCTLLMALVPVLLLPVLLGGVGWFKALATMSVHASVFLIALVAGLVVSSLAERPVRAALGAVVFALVAVAPLNLLLATAFGVELWPPLFLPVGWLPTAPVISVMAGVGLSLTLLVGTAIVATIGGLWQTARQVTLFWQEAESSTDRLRAAVGMWIRIVGSVALMTQIVLAVNCWAGGRWAVSRETGIWLNLTWLLPLPLLAAAVSVNRLAARAGDPLASRHSGWRFFCFWVVFTGMCPLTVASLWTGNLGAHPFFMLLNATTIAAVGISAGVLAYAWRRRWATALVWSLVFSGALTAAALATIGGAAFWRGEILLEDTGAMADSPMSQWLMSPLLGMAFIVTGSSEFLSAANVFTGIPPTHHGLLSAMVLQNALALTVAAVVAALTLPLLLARRLRACATTHALEESRALRHDFCEPLVGRRWFAQRQQQLLNTNPIGWLHARQWSARLTGWGWCLAAVITQVPVFLELRGIDSMLLQQTWLLTALQAGVAFAAASSFQREKLSGVLELILVTPISAQQIVNGRWVALIRQFLPTLGLVALLLILTLQMMWYRPGNPAAFAVVLIAVLPILSLPLIGLYLSLRLRSVMAAWLATCGIGLGITLAGPFASAVLMSFLMPSVSALTPSDPGAAWSLGDWVWMALLVATCGSLHLAGARYAWRRSVEGLSSRRLVLPS